MSKKKSATTVTIDGEVYNLPVMKFKTLKKAFPIIEEVQASDDPIAMSEAAIKVISMALMQNPAYDKMTPEHIEDIIDAKETFELAPAMFALMQESGLIPKNAKMELASSGEAEGAEDAPSMEISTPSSQNSSQPDALAATGT